MALDILMFLGVVNGSLFSAAVLFEVGRISWQDGFQPGRESDVGSTALVLKSVGARSLYLVAHEIVGRGQRF